MVRSEIIACSYRYCLLFPLSISVSRSTPLNKSKFSQEICLVDGNAGDAPERYVPHAVWYRRPTIFMVSQRSIS